MLIEKFTFYQRSRFLAWLFTMKFAWPSLRRGLSKIVETSFAACQALVIGFIISQVNSSAGLPDGI
jgi:hypothetical protein